MSTQHAAEPIERKIQLTGNSTFVVSLPKEWAVAQNIESGASMYLYPYRDRVIVAADPLDGPDRATTIDAHGLDPETIRRRVRAAYVAGCDVITVTVGVAATDTEIDDDTRMAVENAANRLVGLEISGADSASVVATNLLDVDDVSLEQTVAQMREIALSMHEDAIEAVRTDDTDLARQVSGRDDDVDRLFAVVARVFHRGLEHVAELDSLDVDRSSVFRIYRTARQLERIADHAERIAIVATMQDGPPETSFGDRLATAGADARRVVELAVLDDVNAVIGTCSSVCASIRTLYDDVPRGDDAHLYGPVLEQIRRTAVCGVNVTDASFEAAALDGLDGGR